MDWQKYASTINTLVATVAIVASGLWAYYEYETQANLALVQAKLALEAQQFEAAKPFLQRQLDLCVEASNAAATLASAQDPERVAAAMDRFWELYWGSLHIVEDFGDDSVEDMMFDFGKKVEKLPSDAKILAALDAGERGLKFDSLDLAKACRRLIEQSWQSVVPQLRER